VPAVAFRRSWARLEKPIRRLEDGLIVLDATERRRLEFVPRNPPKVDAAVKTWTGWMSETKNRLAGLFELPVLSFGGKLADTGGTGGAFWTGILAAFVATPCTGPFMAGALGAALLLPGIAALADRFAFIRSLVGSAGAHDAFHRCKRFLERSQTAGPCRRNSQRGDVGGIAQGVPLGGREIGFGSHRKLS
jgi:hypothetical protein